MFVADTAVGAIKVVTPTNSLCKFLELLDSLCRMFGIHLRGVQAETHSIEDAISSLSELSSVVDLWVDEVQEKKWEGKQQLRDLKEQYRQKANAALKFSASHYVH